MRDHNGDGGYNAPGRLKADEICLTTGGPPV